MKKKSKVIAIAAPTATGKSKLAVELAHKLNGEIVSADSRLVYKGFEIAVAKPTLEEREGIPHYLIDVVEPEIDYSVANYADDAIVAIEGILSRGKVPIIVGGTGLYFRILLEGYDIPRVEPNIDLRNELNELSLDKLIVRLKKIDKEYFEQVNELDKRKVIRAIEVSETLGHPFSSLNKQKEQPYDVEWIGINLPREEIYKRVNERVDRMVKLGLIDETKYLLQKHGRIPNFVNTIGYKEIIQYFDNEISLDKAIELIKQHSRNYAKRQLTWFRKNKALGIN
ncbi:tRNA (adenosine(37)-N6)-dimethylallyltransferase MiaA [bacterium]|nr:tRNA (adenosine(37)-N6)-dimethylallyltransferase MiaA [bacterium]